MSEASSGRSASAASKDQILAQLERILSNARFSSSERLSGFLRFVTDLSLQNRAGEIKEFVIATEVYGRGNDYDPQVDSIVRVEASRLRSKLRDYYATDGQADPLIIRVPRGSYAPEFEVVAPPAPPPQPTPTDLPTRPWKPLAAAGALALLAAIGWALVRGNEALVSAPLAVLPFVNLGAFPDDERFADGITEELTAQLARKPGLQLRAPNALGSYKARTVDFTRVGRELGVKAVVEGSVRHEADRYLVTVQLIHTKDGRHVWSQIFDRRSTDPLTLQREVAEAASHLIAVHSTALESSRSGHVELNASAAAIYTEGLRLLHLNHRLLRNQGRVPPDLDKAIELLEQTVQQNPAFAKGWADLGAACDVAFDFDRSRAPAFKRRADEALAKAIELDPNLAEAHATAGSIRFYRDWDWPNAESFLKRAIDLDPRNAGPRKEYSDLLRLRGDSQRALLELTRAQSLAPESDVLATQKALLLLDARRYDEAVREAEEALARRPDAREAHWLIGLCFQLQGKHREAEARYRQILAASPRDGRALPALGHLLGELGRKQEARKIAMDIQELAKRGPGMEYPLALVHAGIGDRGAALEWLQRAYTQRDPSIMYLKVDPRFAMLRSDTRFVELLKRLHLD